MGSTRRAIIPLYNLQAHNVMTNLIVDAGTDAKIAKFQKRGLELIDLAFIEPVEVWGEKEGRKKLGKGEDAGKKVRRECMGLNVDETGVVTDSGSGRNNAHDGGLQMLKSIGPLAQGGIVDGNRTRSRPATPSAASSAVSLGSHLSASSTHGGPRGQASEGNRSLHPSEPRPSIRPDLRSSSSDASPTPTPTPKKNIFGKLFNKRNSVNAPSDSSTTNTPVATPHSKYTEGFPSFSSFSILQAPKTPKAQQMAKQTDEKGDEAVSPTPTVVPTGKNTKGTGHTRNLSLTAITTPMKATMKSNRNRLSELVSGAAAPLPNSTPFGALGIIEDKGPMVRLSADRKSNNGRDSSPNPSVAKSTKSRFSWVGTSTTTGTQSTESLGSHGQKEPLSAATLQQTYPSIMSPSHSEGVANIRQQQQQQLQLRPPVLGIQPTFISAVLSPPPTYLTASGSVTSPLVSALSPRMDGEVSLQGQRALMYVWLVKRWLKKKQGFAIFGSSGGESSSGGVGVFFGKKKEALSNTSDTSLGGNPVVPPAMQYGGVEVRFEWKRAKGKEAKRNRGGRRIRSRNRTASGGSSIIDVGAESDAEFERSSRRGREKRETIELVKGDEKKAHRMSTGSFSTTNMSDDGFGVESSPGSRKEATGGGDDGEDSDPEDSETPWVCTLKIRRSAIAAVGGREPVSPETQVLRVKVGTLSPMPHHPKVVAMLKVPFPLPDVQVERMAVVKRDVRSIGMGSSSQGLQDDENGSATKGPYVGLTLTAEEIKDIVCSTGLWLVVRESFGGIGKVTRKGDGWRIRG